MMFKVSKISITFILFGNVFLILIFLVLVGNVFFVLIFLVLVVSIFLIFLFLNTHKSNYAKQITSYNPV